MIDPERSTDRGSDSKSKIEYEAADLSAGARDPLLYRTAGRIIAVWLAVQMLLVLNALLARRTGRAACSTARC